MENWFMNVSGVRILYWISSYLNLVLILLCPVRSVRLWITFLPCATAYAHMGERNFRLAELALLVNLLKNTHLHTWIHIHSRNSQSNLHLLTGLKTFYAPFLTGYPLQYNRVHLAPYGLQHALPRSFIMISRQSLRLFRMIIFIAPWFIGMNIYNATSHSL